LLPLLIVGLVANERSQTILYDKAVKRTEVALSSAMDYIDLTLQNVEEISTLMATDSTLIGLLDHNRAEVTPQTIVDFSQVLKQLSNVNSVNHIVSQVTIYHQPSHMLISTAKGGKRIDPPAQQSWFEETARSIGSGIRYVRKDDIVEGSTTIGSLIGSDGISLVRSMDIYNLDRKPNILILSLNNGKFLDVLRGQLPSEHASILLYNSSHQLVASTGGNGTTGPLEGGADSVSVSIDSKVSKWTLTLVQPKSELYREINHLRLYTFIMMGVSVLLAFIISWIVYSGIASPVQRLLQGLRQLSGGKLDVKLENKRKDELGALTEAFNHMASQQKHLIEDHYEQELRLVKTELKFLQSQINPHFLYNTLDSIYWAAKNYEADEISEMVIHLSRFFRLSLSKGNEVFTVEESVAHLHDYVRIQQLRFLESFTVEYRLSEDSKNVPILRLLLQPIVENAILHGMESKPQGGRLIVASRIDGPNLVIEVVDNGTGMPEPRLRYIQEELDRLKRRYNRLFPYEEKSANDLFGLRNVMTRIRIYYGPEADLTIDSIEGEETRVTVTLPLEQCGEEFKLRAEDAMQKGVTQT
jgi:two-component system sensor histidine kinase YesM